MWRSAAGRSTWCCLWRRHCAQLRVCSCRREATLSGVPQPVSSPHPSRSRCLRTRERRPNFYSPPAKLILRYSLCAVQAITSFAWSWSINWPSLCWVFIHRKMARCWMAGFLLLRQHAACGSSAANRSPFYTLVHYSVSRGATRPFYRGEKMASVANLSFFTFWQEESHYHLLSNVTSSLALRSNQWLLNLTWLPLSHYYLTALLIHRRRSNYSSLSCENSNASSTVFRYFNSILKSHVPALVLRAGDALIFIKPLIVLIIIRGNLNQY